MIKKASDLKPGDMVLCSHGFGAALREVERLTEKRVYVASKVAARFNHLMIQNRAPLDGYLVSYFSKSRKSVIVTDEHTARRAMAEWQNYDEEIHELEAKLGHARERRKAAVLAIFAEDTETGAAAGPATGGTTT